MITPKVPINTTAVADHYDELDVWYRRIWGDHVHHGLWLDGSAPVRDATRALVTHLADALALRPGERVCDAGCGYGATARLLAEAYRVRVTGVTLSKSQHAYAVTRTEAGGPLEFTCGDFLANSFAGGTFDAVIAIESTEHMADKSRFFAEASRILRPGGRIGVYAWLATDSLRPWERRHLLEPICDEGRLAGLGTPHEYRTWLSTAGFQEIGFRDLTVNVRRTWPIILGRTVPRLVWDRQAWRFLLTGAGNRVFVKTIFRITAAYYTRAMRYGLFTAVK